MKTTTTICIFVMNLLIDGLCETSCERKGEEEALITKDGGKVTLRVTSKEEIHEVHWIRKLTQNVFFRILDCCSFEKYCCQSENPENCCKIENQTYEAKLCSCDISSSNSSITMCNLTREDEGVFLAEIAHNTKQKKYSMCTFYLNIDDKPKPQAESTNLALCVCCVCKKKQRERNMRNLRPEDRFSLPTGVEEAGAVFLPGSDTAVSSRDSSEMISTF